MENSAAEKKTSAAAASAPGKRLFYVQMPYFMIFFSSSIKVSTSLNSRYTEANLT